ncbi:MAG TPA: FmdB family zinc ribbon protein [Pseudonocardiaceae bacterium]|nr:FmdB family zinc ribbon protein [Pseudonocardiaceae bacterium]
MPTYSYACTACEHRFDTVQKFTDSSLTDCPECSGRLRKLFSPVGIVFKGSGFYRTDSRSGGQPHDGQSSSNGKSESGAHGKSESNGKSDSGADKKAESGTSESSTNGKSTSEATPSKSGSAKSKSGSGSASPASSSVTASAS